MAGQGQGPSRRPPSISNLNSSHLHNRSWGSDDWQRLLSTHFGGGEEGVPQSDPLFRLTSDGTMLSELLSTLETGDPNGAGDPTAPLFSEDTINAILGEKLRETAAQVANEMSQQQQHQAGAAQQPTAVVDMQTVLSGHSTSSMMSLHEVTAAMQTHLHAQTQPLGAHPSAMAPAAPMTNPVPTLQQQQAQQQQQGQQQYVTLLDGRVLQQPDGSAVLASVASGQQPLAVALPGSNSVLQYIPVLNSQVVTLPQIQVQVQPTTTAQQHQQQQLAVAAMAAATLSGGGALSDGSGAVLPTTSNTPPATTPTSAAAATAAVYTSEISTTQQLVATAAAQQQWLQQEAAAANAANSGGGATNAANVAMREATAAMADVALHQSTTTSTGNGIAPGQVSPTSLSMPPPPPRPPRLQQPSLDASTNPAASTLQPPSLTPQLRPATTEPFPKSLASAVLAAAQASNAAAAAANGGQQHQDPTTTTAAAVHQQQQAPAAPTPLLRPAGSMEIPEDGQLPRRPSHKRERSLRSASPALADPSTAPTIKCAKGHNDGGADDIGSGGSGSGSGSGLGTSPDSCILAAAVATSVGGSSGDVSPLNAVYMQANVMPEPPLSPHRPPQQQQQQQQSVSAPELKNNTSNSTAGAAGTFEVDDDVVALMQAALAPKAGKRRGRPPGTTKNPAAVGGAVSASAATTGSGGVPSASQPREVTDAEILENLLKEDPSRRHLSVEEIKKLVRKEKNRIAAAISRSRTANYTAALESRVKALQAEQAELSGWLQAPPQALPHRVLLVGPAAAAAASAAVTGGVGGGDAAGRPPVRHLSL